MIRRALRWCWIGLVGACAGPHEAKVAPPPPDDTCAPAMGAPPLEGLIPICADIYVDPVTTAEERERLVRDVREARKTAWTSLGVLESKRPIAVFCKSEDCAVRIVGPARRSFTRMHGIDPSLPRPTIVMVRVDPGVRGVVVHEMLHAELAVRLGTNHVPSWFDEGFVVTYSGEPDCTTVAPKGIDDLRRLDGGYEYFEYTNLPGLLEPTYCQSAAEIRAWTRKHGKPALLELVKAVHDGASFYEAYGPMASPSTSSSPLPAALATEHRLHDGRWGTVRLAGTSDSYAVTSNAVDIADPKRPFSFSLWMKADKRAGLLAHVSTTMEPGWCEPFIGFDREGRVTSQIVVRPSPQLASFAVATDPATRPVRVWTHIAMTWSPTGGNRLYVGGTKVAEAPAPTFAAARLGTALDVAWGGNRHRSCWPGALEDAPFAGEMADMNLVSRELTEAEVKTLAQSPPP